MLNQRCPEKKGTARDAPRALNRMVLCSSRATDNTEKYGEIKNFKIFIMLRICRENVIFCRFCHNFIENRISFHELCFMKFFQI